MPYSPHKEVVERISKARAVSRFKKHQNKMLSFVRAKLETEKEMGKISRRDLFLLGLGVYIGDLWNGSCYKC